MKYFFTLVIGMLSLSILIAQPANNNCGTAQALAINPIAQQCYGPQQIQGATFDGNQPGNCNQLGALGNAPPNIWYSFVAEGPQITISLTANPAMAITLVQYAGGNCLGNPTILTCSNPGNALQFNNLVIGNTYFFFVSGPTFPPATTPINNLCILNLAPVPPPNNVPCDAVTLNPNQMVMGTTENAGNTFGNPATFPCPQAATQDVWYTFTVNNRQDKIELEIIGGSVGNQIQAILGQFNNGCNGTFTWLPPRAFCGEPNNTITYTCLNPGTYYVMISTSQANQGTFNLRLTVTPPPPNCGLNSDCNSPTPIPTLVLNQPITNSCVAGCNIGACGETFTSQGCNYNGAVVWFSVTVPAGAALLNINVTGTGPTPLENPFIQVFATQCGGTVISDCQVGANGTVALIGLDNIVGGNTYFIAVGNNSGEPGYFNICASATDPQTACLTGATANVPPGPFCPDKEIDISYTLNYTSAGNNCQWPHAVIPVFGDCYVIDDANMPSFGNWVWFPAGAVTYNLLNTAINIYDTDNGPKLCYPLLDPNCTGSPLMEGTGMPAGWYWINQPGNCPGQPLTDPNNTWGMPCGGCGGTCSATFNFRIKTKDVDECEGDPNAIDCGIQFYVFSDRQTGCWTQGGANTCGADFPLYINRSLNCVRPPDVEPATASICSGDAFFIQLASTPFAPGTEYTWTIGATNGIQGASAGGGPIINQTLTNPTNAPQTVIYLVTAVDPSGCDNGNPTEIPVTVLPEINVNMVTDPADASGCANTEFGITVNATGGDGSFSYNWSHDPQESGSNINVLPGSEANFLYTVTVTDGSGCTKSETVTITVNPEIFVEFAIDATEFCESDGPKLLTLSTSAALQSTQWSAPPGYNQGFNNNIARISATQHSGLYSVTITDIFGCQGTADTLITVYANPRIIGAGNPNTTFCMDQNAPDDLLITFNVQGSGGETFFWSSSVTAANDYIDENVGVMYIRDLFNALGPGTYDLNVVVTDNVGCSTERSWDVVLIAPPIISINPVDTLCATANPVTLLATPSGGTWSGVGVVGNTFNPLATPGSGNYVIYYRVIDGACDVRDSITITIRPEPEVNINPVGDFCFDDGNPRQLSATPTDGVWLGTGVDNTGLFTPPNTPGNYRVYYRVLRDFCFFFDSIDIRVFPEVVIDYTFDNAICIDESVTFTFSGVAPPNQDIFWELDDDTSYAPLANYGARFSFSNPGLRRIIMRQLRVNIDPANNLFCSAGPDTFFVDVQAPLDPVVLFCQEVTTTSVTFGWNPINGATGYLVEYNGGTDIIGAGGNLRFTVLDIPPGAVRNVTITVTPLGDGECGDGDPVSFTCTSLPCPDISINLGPDQSFCLYSDIPNLTIVPEILGSDGSGAFTWSGTSFINQSGVFDVQAAGAGSHTITYELIEQSCTYSDQLTINTYAPPIANWTADNLEVCKDTPINFSFTGSGNNPGLEVNWLFEQGVPSSGTGTGNQTVTWNTAGTWTVTLTMLDDFCEDVYESDVTIEEPLIPIVPNCGSNPISITFFWNEVPGSIHFLVTNPITGVQFITNETSFFIDNLDPSVVHTYTITVQAIGTGVCGNGEPVTWDCMTQECDDITINIDPVDPICLNSGALPFPLTFVKNDGTDDYTVRWTGSSPGIIGQESGIFNPQLAGVGTHTITLTIIENFCPYTDVIDIEIIEVPSAAFTATQLICTGVNSNIQFLGNPMDLSFNWNFDGGIVTSGDPNSGIFTLSWTTAGLKQVRLVVTDSNGCISDPFIVEIDVRAPFLPVSFVECLSSTESILFEWNTVPFVTGYRVIVGPPLNLNFVTTETTYLIEGLGEGQSIQITVVPLGEEPCGDGPANSITCETEVCPDISLNITQVPFICLNEQAQPITLSVNIVGGAGNGTRLWSGNGIVDPSSGIFDPVIAGVGRHTIRLDYQERLCRYDNSIEIEVRFVPNGNIQVTSPVCIGQESDIQFIGTAGLNPVYDWTIGGGGVIQNGAGTPNIDVVWSTSGTKIISLNVISEGCAAIIPVTSVEVEQPLQNPAISCNTTITSITFNWNAISGNQGYEITINGGGPQVIPNNTISFNDMTLGDSILLTVIALNQGPCGNSQIDSLWCFAADCPEMDVDIVNIDPICLGNNTGSVQLNATVSGGSISGPETYNWTGIGITNRENGMFDPVVAGPGRHQIFLTYRVSVCPYQTSAFIDVIQSPELQLSLTDPKCFGINDGLISILEIDGGVEPFLFSIDGGSFVSSDVFSGLRPGSHIVRVRDSNGCTNEYSVNLTQPQPLVVDLGPSLLVDQEDVVTLHPQLNIPKDSVVSYLWSGDPSLTCLTCDSTQVIPLNQTTISLTVTDVNNCRATDDVTIFVRLRRRVFIPNAFTPNGDGRNDYFNVYGGVEVSSIKSLKVFDRWGNMVFERLDFKPVYRTDPEDTNGWDGTFRGKSVRPGVFVYHAVVEFLDGSTDDYYGEVTILNTEK